MKRIILVILIAIATICVNAQGIVFEKGTFNEALKKAEKENKLVFIDFYTVWCGPCKRLDKEVFTQKDIGDFYNTHFINLKVDAEKGEGIKLKKKYGIKSYPTLIFVNSKGELIHKKIGISKNNSHKDIADLGRTAVDSGKTQYGMHKRYESGERSPQFIKEYLLSLKRQKNPKWKKVFDLHVDETPKQDFLSKEGFYFLIEYAEVNTRAMDFIFAHETEYNEILDGKFYDQVFRYKARELSLLKHSGNNKEYDEACAYLKEKMGAGYNQLSDYMEYTFKISLDKKVNEGFALAVKYANKYGPEDVSIFKSVVSWMSYSEGINENILREGVKLMDKAIELDNENRISYMDVKVAILHRLGKKQEAGEIFQEVLENTPENKRKSLVSFYVMHQFK